MTPPDEPATRGGYVLPPPVAAGEFVGPPDDLDRYELIGPGIAGGEGVTWRARYHGQLKEPLPLAVKALRPPPGTGDDWPTDADRARWQDQAALLRHLHLDHVVRLYEIFSGPAPHPSGAGDDATGRAAYLVMEWVDGPTLHELCADQPAAGSTIEERMAFVGQAATVLRELASTTRAAGNPSLHRDVKPGNCIINGERGLVLVDVSTLRLVDDSFDPVGLHTPAYTAPEVLAAPHLPRMPATDVYSLGALAYFCVTGQDPAPGAADRGRLEASLRATGVRDAQALTRHIMTTVDPDPARRPADLAEWRRELLTLGRRVRPRRRGPVYLAAAAAALTASITVLNWPTLPRGERAGPTLPTPAVSTASALGAIVSPRDGANVEQCAHLSGTATPEPGMTLVLAMRNLSNGDPTRYVETVYDWDDPSKLANWRGAQYFGQANDTVGQDYEVQLISVAVDMTRRWTESDDNTGDALAASGTVVASVRLHRVAGLVPGNCEGS
ncbi:hypothetical protein Ais01nite_54040 [Asanoa ishikariensis]|uniref:non-specific serine/threonine protein kinase n=1 Tax=Asanoa ishikariensis TaxID=137265 RepID=A0A1H3TSH7_9ACTN|nr:protein kinase [Asanoa ishikariensis]GIF67369.1 hypothetical protein Ais01nite_54040 [Asanoa ishikariensis]SDZ52878.1 Protein kinase domain-containing protein [Asanoa ishikariensis]